MMLEIDPRGKNESHLQWAEKKLERAYVKAIAKFRSMVSVDDVLKMLIDSDLVIQKDEYDDWLATLLTQYEGTDAYERFLLALANAYGILADEIEEVMQASTRLTLEAIRQHAKKVRVEFNIDLRSVNELTVARNQMNKLQLIREHVDYYGKRLNQQSILSVISGRVGESGTGATHVSRNMGITPGVPDRPLYLGDNPRTTAKRFKNSIGLTTRQLQYVRNFRDQLQAGDFTQAKQRKLFPRGRITYRNPQTGQMVERRISDVLRPFIAGRQGIQDQAILDALEQAYYNRMLKYRSEVIGRTEALRAVHQGHEDGLEAAINSGNINPDQITRTWSTSRDERVRDSHVSMEGQLFGSLVANGYLSGNGNTIRYPCDPDAPPEESIQCRCGSIARMEIISPTIDY